MKPDFVLNPIPESEEFEDSDNELDDPTWSPSDWSGSDDSDYSEDDF